MTNHAFASSQKLLTNEELKEAVIEIVNRRFPGIFKVEGEDYLEVIPVHPDPTLNDNWSYLSLQLRSKRKIEMRRGHLVPCSKFKGKCSNEGVSDIWKPEIRFHKYREWFDFLHSHLDKYYDADKAQVLKDQIWKAEIKSLNKAFYDAGLVR